MRKLARLEEVQFMLTHHTSEHFPFLGTSSSLNEMRCRTMFYTSLSRLLMFDLGEDEERFYNFLTPLTSKSIFELLLIIKNIINYAILQISLNHLEMC